MWNIKYPHSLCCHYIGIQQMVPSVLQMIAKPKEANTKFSNFIVIEYLDTFFWAIFITITYLCISSKSGFKTKWYALVVVISCQWCDDILVLRLGLAKFCWNQDVFVRVTRESGVSFAHGDFHAIFVRPSPHVAYSHSLPSPTVNNLKTQQGHFYFEIPGLGVVAR